MNEWINKKVVKIGGNSSMTRLIHTKIRKMEQSNKLK